MRTTYTTTTGDLLTVERDGTDDWTFGVYVGERRAGLLFKETDVTSVGRETWWKRSDNGERYTSTWRAAAAMTGLTVTGEADDDAPVCPRAPRG